MAHTELKFPDVLFVSHFDSSTEDCPSFNADLSEKQVIDDEEVTSVAEYKLVRVRKLQRRVEEVPF